MGYAERRALIEELERLRRSRVIGYVLADRETFPPGAPGFSAQLAPEPHLLFVDHLRSIGKVPRLDLFLYTRGGATDSVWPLVSLLREYCTEFAVIVPFRAHSGGTLICLGADTVLMTEFAELSPIDPTTGNQFNPADPTNPRTKFGISVEDVAAFFKLSEERAGIRAEQNRLEVLRELTRQVHPLALGNVQRVYMQIRRLARALIKSRKDSRVSRRAQDRIIRALTEEFYSHLHAITRTEAQDLMEEWIRCPTGDEEAAIWKLFDQYAMDLSLRDKFNVPAFMGDEPSNKYRAVGGFIDTTAGSHVFVTDVKVTQRPNIPPNINVQVPPGTAIPFEPWASRTYDYGIVSQGWVVGDEGA